MNYDSVRGSTEISLSDMERIGVEIWDSITGKKKWATGGAGGIVEGGFIRGMSHIPRLLHLMNKSQPILLSAT